MLQAFKYSYNTFIVSGLNSIPSNMRDFCHMSPVKWLKLSRSKVVEHLVQLSQGHRLDTFKNYSDFLIPSGLRHSLGLCHRQKLPLVQSVAKQGRNPCSGAPPVHGWQHKIITQNFTLSDAQKGKCKKWSKILILLFSNPAQENRYQLENEAVSVIII